MINTSNIIDDRKLFIYEMALRSAIYAATNRNSPYVKSTTYDVKNKIRNYWKCRLCEIAREVKLYGIATDGEFFIFKMKILWKQLKGKFPNQNFRFSHAQKSLSVFLKYLWCYGEIEEPPICPIDSLIIQVAAKQDNQLGSMRWTQMKDEKEYRTVINALVTFLKSSKFPIARWELEYFNADRRTQREIISYIEKCNKKK